MRYFKMNKLTNAVEIATAKTPRKDRPTEIAAARTPRNARRKLCLVVCLLFLLAGCNGQFLAQPTLIPTDTSTPTITVTATTVWFPATDTPTAMASDVVQPTVDEKPSVEDELLSDDFTNPAQWSTGQTAAGSVAYGDKELTLAVSQPKGALLSLSKVNLAANFYLEITVDLSLCKGGDAYGLLLRASSPENYYRYAIACTGQLRLERVKNSELAIVQDWTPAGQIPAGSPLLLKLGVWSAGNEMRFFINDEYQFSASDPVFTGGMLGVFARSAGDTPVTVSFSDLHLYGLGALPSVTPTPTLTPKPFR
jgi:hypothetical protein